jgi:cell division protein FtsW
MTRLRRLSGLQARFVLPRLTRPDLWLLFAVASLLGLGVVMVFNVTYFHAGDRYGDPFLFFRKHLVSLAIGVAGMLLVSRVRTEWLERWATPLLFASMAALILVLIPGIGVERGGARRWLVLGGFSLQPTELAKPAVVLFLAHWISRHRDSLRESWRACLPVLFSVGLATLLVLAQPDFGAAVILSALLLSMLFIGGVRTPHLLALAGAGGALLAVAVFTAPYRVLRLLAFLDPWEHSQGIGFQLVQSLIAFGSGGLTGVGLGQSRQKLFFLPEAHTDFIFALIGEELGLLGALVVLFLFGLIAARGLRIAVRHPDPFASLLAFGITLVIVLSAVVNVGVVLGVLPTKGLPLPFLSYGGSALLGTMLGVGVLTGLSRMTG